MNCFRKWIFWLLEDSARLHRASRFTHSCTRKMYGGPPRKLCPKCQIKCQRLQIRKLSKMWKQKTERCDSPCIHRFQIWKFSIMWKQEKLRCDMRHRFEAPSPSPSGLGTWYGSHTSIQGARAPSCATSCWAHSSHHSRSTPWWRPHCVPPREHDRKKEEFGDRLTWSTSGW